MWCKSIILLCVVIHLSGGSHVLVVFPMASRSHTSLGDSVVSSLLTAGHNVTYITQHSEVKESGFLRVIDISPGIYEQRDADVPHLLDRAANPRAPYKILFVGLRSAERALRHHLVQDLLNDRSEHFDVVVAEWFYSGLLAPLATVFECPLIWYSAVDASWMNLQLVHEPSSPLYGVDLQALTRATAATTVGDRLHRIWRQTYLSAWIYYITNYIEAPAYYEIYQAAIQERGRTPPLYESLVYNASMLLINSSPLLGQGLPLPENAKYIGGHHIQAPEPLPKDLKTILDNSKHGVIYFSFGSSLKSEDLPEDMVTELLKVFRQLEQTVVWKYDGHVEHLPANVHLVKWAPQQSILRHPKTLMMITHGGFLSYMEAMYYGVPMIGVPFYGDQFLTMDIAQAGGRGIKVLFSNRLPQRIREAIDMMLATYSYRRKAKEASFIMHQHLVPPSQELVHWVNLVVSTRGAPHLHSPAVELSLMERLQVDVVAVVLMALWFLSKVFKLIKVYWDDWGNGPSGESKELKIQ